jgi:hypothetical protein
MVMGEVLQMPINYNRSIVPYAKQFHYLSDTWFCFFAVVDKIADRGPDCFDFQQLAQ